jgi:hypothetical protein
MKRVFLALFAIGLTQPGYCGWKDALKEVAKQVAEQSVQAQPQQHAVQQESSGSESSASQQRTAEQVQQENQEKQKILLLEQKYPHNWLSQFRMAQYGFKPEDKEAIAKLAALEKLILPVVQVDEYSPAKLGTGVKMSEVFAIFGVDEKDEARRKEFISWMQYRWKNVFLKHCTALYQLTKKLDLNGLDDLPTKQKLDYLSKVHFKVDDNAPYLVDASPFRGKAIQMSAVDVETAYQGYQGGEKDDAAIAKVAKQVQERDLEKRQKEEKAKKIEALSRKTGTPDVEVSIGTNQFHGTLTFDLQAIADRATIWKVSVNRGNCVMAEGTATEIDRTISLRFGQTYRGYSNKCQMQNVREIEVVTDNGRFVFNF